jgi:hypothetical protein
MIARIASLLGFGGVAGMAAPIGSAYGPSDCPLCCGRSAVAQGTHLSQERLAVRKEAPMSLLRGYTFGNAENVIASRSSFTKGAQR